jgi:small neutral amino acid transporter SnatA (MarC family)
MEESMIWYKFMCFYFDEIFFGSLLILFGIALILKTIFKLNLPLWPIFGGIALMYAGFSMLTSNIRKSCCKKEKFSRIQEKN